MKRVFDFFIALTGLLFLLPFTLIILFLIWIQDFSSPFYVAPRVGKNGKMFKMIKLRSMVKNADRTGVDSTSANDMRITRIGHFIRKFKLDELSQIWNVLLGDMSFVGPRPNVKKETDLYTDEEKKLITIRPGITDFSSIVFSDEGDILKDHPDPDIGYNQLIRPWKSRLGIIYVEHGNFFIDLKLVALTVVAVVSRERALKGINKMLISMDAPSEVIEVAKREKKLIPCPPPGSSKIVTSRDINF
ncbi:MAG: sugar transferase [Spirochaetes bacterium]|nr:sugar transferase [Spirochaetota bacterium]